ncbi:MAG: TonB-dependent receptor [Bacteroidales bacterium]|nr:TonB-dependent receptor [Bacteroidales bacterium]
MKKIGLLLSILLCAVVISEAQILIKGTVTSFDDGEKLPGVNVFVKGTTNGTITDIDGNYNLRVESENSVLVFSFIGMQTFEQTIGAKRIIDVSLKADVMNLDEVVAVGYGTMKKSDVTGSVASVSASDIAESGGGTLEQSLAGRMAGVVVNTTDNAPGAGLDIRIRGTNSINASSAPLYVIDGFPVEGDFDQGGNLESTGQSPLSGLDPNDIESIDILKDASATAIYGARGANGVVIVTTKSGKDGKMEVTFNAQSGVQSMIEQYEALDALGYAKYQHERYYPYSKRMDEPDPNDPNIKWWNYETYKDSTSTNWMDEITQLGVIQNYNLSLSGGNKKGNYLASVGYYNNKGIIKETDFERYTANFKGIAKPNDWMDVAINSKTSYSKNNGTVTVNSVGAANSTGIIHQAIKTSPLRSPQDETLETDDADGVIGNPLATLNNVDMVRENLQTINNVSVTIKPTKDLRIKVLGGMTHSIADFYYYAPSTTSWGSLYNGRARILNNKRTSWLNENTISYKKNIKGHRFDLLGGVTIQSNHNISTEMEATNFPIESLGYKNIGVGESFSTPFSFAEEYILASYLSRLNYNYKDRYLVTASFRADGSSKFSANNKWGYFPSFALGWRLSEEAFMKNLGIFDNLKLRAGWGETGNPNIPPYQSLTNYAIDKYPSGSNLNSAVYPANAGNPNLRWETSVQTNFGLDIGVLNNRISAVIDIYYKTTDDLLLEGDIPPSTGYNTYLYNSGKIENKGIEFALNTVNLNGTFKWFTNFNLAINKNKVLDVGDFTSGDIINVPGTNTYSTAILQKGEPLGLWHGYKTDGLWQQSDFTWNGYGYDLKPIGNDDEGNPIYPAALGNAAPGRWRYQDIDGNGEINAEDKTIIGISQPDFTGGLNNSFEYKNFDLAILLEFSVGKDVYNANNRFFIEPSSIGANTIHSDYWLPIQYELDENGNETSVVLDPGNPDAKYPGPGGGDPFGDNHDAYIEDGSYLRIKNISMGYTFKKEVLNAVRLSSLRVYANVLNLYTFTNYSGYDPAVDSQSIGGLRPGYDFNSYPLARTFMFGVSAKF